MEDKLSNIESLLKQLLAAQKPDSGPQTTMDDNEQEESSNDGQSVRTHSIRLGLASCLSFLCCELTEPLSLAP